MKVKRGSVMSCVYWIVLISVVCMVTAIEEGSLSAAAVASGGRLSRYEVEKRRDWNTFLQYMKEHQPPLTLESCSGAHVVEFLKLLDKFGRTQAHVSDCPHFGDPNKSQALCACPFKRTWRSLFNMIAGLRVAYKESGGQPESNPFGAPAVKIYILQVKECEEKTIGIPHHGKKRKHATVGEAGGASSGGAGSGELGSSSAVTSERPFRRKYEDKKKRDWNTFLEYLQNHKPPLTLEHFSGADVIEFLKYLDEFGITQVHIQGCCPYYGNLKSPVGLCACPIKQAWSTLDGLIGRLNAAYRESGGSPESNPFRAQVVRKYLRKVKDSHAKARGTTYKTKKRKRASGGVGSEPAASAGGGMIDRS